MKKLFLSVLLIFGISGCITVNQYSNVPWRSQPQQQSDDEVAPGALARSQDYVAGTVIVSAELDAEFTELYAAIGTQTFTEQNVVTDDETSTASLDALDQAIGDQTYVEENFVTDAEDLSDSIDVLDQAVYDAGVTAAAATSTNSVYSMFKGYLRRAKFTWKDADEIYINSGMYHYSGVSEQIMIIESQLTFQFGSAGSNADSTDLCANDIFYLAIDASVVESGTTTVLSAAMLSATTGTPAYSQDKLGYYIGNDRVIAGFLTNTSSGVSEFFHDGGDFFGYAGQIEDLAATDIDTTWTDVTLTGPSFAQKFNCSFVVYSAVENLKSAYWRTNGQVATTGHTYYQWSAANGHYQSPAFSVVTTDSSQKIEIKHSASDSSTSAVYTHGYYFPSGM
jgi:hypothetical protein